jgi:predicted metal-binding integral membrane protein DUF2182
MMLDLRKRPENLALVLALGAWSWMLMGALEAGHLRCCTSCGSALEELAGWLGMVIAMMMPNTLDALREVSARSYRQRRVRAVSGYLLGYLGPWALVGVLLLVFGQWSVARDLRVALALGLFGAAWTLLPARERWHRRCHRTIALCPVGWRADRDTLRQGAIHGWPCVASCWPLMVACAITGHHLLLMLGGAILSAYEKRMYHFRRRPLVVGALLLTVTTLGAFA